MKTVYQTNDGGLFATRAEAASHEDLNTGIGKLALFLADKNFSARSRARVLANLLWDNKEEIMRILQNQK